MDDPVAARGIENQYQARQKIPITGAMLRKALTSPEFLSARKLGYQHADTGEVHFIIYRTTQDTLAFGDVLLCDSDSTQNAVIIDHRTPYDDQRHIPIVSYHTHSHRNELGPTESDLRKAGRTIITGMVDASDEWLLKGTPVHALDVVDKKPLPMLLYQALHAVEPEVVEDLYASMAHSRGYLAPVADNINESGMVSTIHPRGQEQSPQMSVIVQELEATEHFRAGIIRPKRRLSATERQEIDRYAFDIRVHPFDFEAALSRGDEL